MSNYNKDKYRLIKFEDGRYGYEFLGDTSGKWLRSDHAGTEEEVIGLLEFFTKQDAEAQKILSMKAEVVE